ncbi:C6 zinc finger domain-containing protein [Colletotrichum kahawae]|uniref:C6 zinc finger domain-containing protein n=1 Tax=Colletotrichum kahawae TaxID=34407 RepID=A0AAD9YU27_COLKA|nr:C6 zinc finger domain-containing protein [Colletotrichum kahawae]
MERQPRRRRRPALSCLECRRRKIKCDRNDPCTHCVSSKNQCTYKTYRNDPEARGTAPGSDVGRAISNSASRPTSPAVAGRAAPPNLGRSFQDLADTASPQTIRADERPIRTSDAVGPHNKSPQNHSSETEPDLQDLLRRLQRLERDSTGPNNLDSSGLARNLLSSHSGPQDSQVVLKKSRLWRWSDWMGEAEEFDPVLTWFTAYTEAKDPTKESPFQNVATQVLAVEIDSLYQNCKVLAKRLKVCRPTRSISSPSPSLMPPSREVADAMVDSYLNSFESVHRILHVPTFWAEYHEYWDHPETTTMDVRLKILLVIGMGSSLSEHGDVALRQTATHWVYAAQSWLSGPLEKDRLGITGLQVHCLTLLARQIFSVGGDLIWMSMGSLIHRAMQIGLHRDPKHLPKMSFLQAELRRRLWATILELVVQSSLDSAMPPRLSFDEFDTEAPSNINDDEMDESTDIVEPHPRHVFTNTSLQLLLLDSLPTRLKILQLLNDLHSELSYTDALALSDEIATACRENMAFGKRYEAREITTFHRNLVDYLVRRFMLPLHCPFANKARSNPLFHYSIRASLDASMAIISPEPDEKFSRLMAVSGGLVREGFRYAIATISLEFLAVAKSQQLDGTTHRDDRYRALLKSSVKDLIEMSAERIRQGDTNIKGHMFLSMIVAQVEAMEEGHSGEQMIAQSAKNSLEFCNSILLRRLENVPSPWNTDTSTMAADREGQEAFAIDWEFDFFLPDTEFAAS